MAQKMKVALLTKPGVIEIVERGIPVPADDEVLIRVRAVGLCGSDVHYYEHGKIGPYVVEKPIILGHEASGDIAAAGKNVRHLKEGQRVAIEPGVTCGRCAHCKAGRYNLCPHVRFLATPPVDGAFCEYIAMRSDFVFPIPDHLSYEAAAMVEPLSVGIHAVRRGRLQPGQTVAVFGMGPVGILAAVAAKAFGAKRVVGVDLEAFRLDVALRMGATDVVNIRERDPVEAIRAMTDGIGVDLAVETAGNPKALQAAVASVRRGGSVSVVGLPPQNEAPLNVSHVVDNEIDIRGVFRYRNTYPAGIDLLAAGQIDLSPMFTDKMSLENTPEAFRKAIHEKSRTVKIVIYP